MKKLATKSGRLVAAPTLEMWVLECRGGNLPPAGEHSSPLRCVSFLFVGAICDRPLGCCVQHVFDEDAIPGGGIVNKDMGHRTDQFAVLNNRTSGHADVK